MTDEQLVKRVANAMSARRRELIGQPLERVWEDLALAAIEAIRAADTYKEPDWV